ncbi:tetratricopeptide (TPR) repeat protein [Pedobacter africanus]|uniref:Tetratricopeptide (TPR) repeat protein n=1 Tax=Pedobacter africanus TaxID=151894 RepID=A0ACC6KZI1_9SPHI|nr:RagB/SusD family nutrient uptake outer membrane protein [Pedobacter africanus]MDR6784577.1 tetratricopeptide (TPR) repeat protein [Pedobacter africanus]
MKTIIKMRLIIIVLGLLCFSCKKYLDEKPDLSLAVPSTIIDLQLLMDNYQQLNSSYPILSEMMTDDYYPESWNNVLEDYRNIATWSGKEVLYASPWASSYSSILTFNVVLDHVDKVSFKKDEAALKKHLKGSALFFRAFYYYGLTQMYANPFDQNTAKNDLGIVLRNTSDFNAPSVRATNEQTYHQIISDLKESADLLPENQSSPNRPIKAAAHGLLARVYLSMKDYANAGIYAEKVLVLNSQLMNFNDLNASSTNPINRFNKEVIFPMTTGGRIFAYQPTFVDSTLVKSYHINDLRKSCFFHQNSNGTYCFKGDYDGTGFIDYDPSPFVFAGLATDEMYLIKAECLARTGKVNEAMETLNDLLITRWKTGTFVVFSASNRNEALTYILGERRKELVFRTLRWEDLRRLQNDPLFSVTPRRIVNGQEYILLPNSPRYLLKIPSKIIEQTGMQQNP